MELFVGREDELRETLSLLQKPNDGLVQDVIGVHGIGKTMFLDRLAATAAELENVQVFRIDMAELGLGEGFFNDFGPTATAQVLWATFDCSRRLMHRFADLSGTDDFDGFRLAYQHQSRLADSFFVRTDIRLGRSSQVQDSEIVSSLNVSTEYVKQRIREMQSALDDAFVTDWMDYSRRRRILITADTFQGVADDELGHWMTRLALRLTNTMLVIARTPSKHVLAKTSARFHKRNLMNLTLDEVRAYLDKRSSGSARPALADVVYAFTDGHPGGVMLACDLIWEKNPSTLRAGEFRRLLERLPEAPSERWGELVHLILSAIDRPRLREAVDAAALTTSFDGPLLSRLIGISPEENVGDLISTLRAYRLVQPLPSATGEPSDRLRLHEFLRISVAGRLRTSDKDRWQRYHEAAAEYWFQHLRRWDEAAYKSYGSWYRHEDTDWQESKREWLRHSGRFTENRELTRARFTLVFLDAFWWWGVYLPFPFNRRLLEDWERTAAVWQAYASRRPFPIDERDEQDQQLLDALTYLLDNYPTGYLKAADAPWDEIRDQLLLVGDLCELHRLNRPGLPDETRMDLTRTAALLDVFLAHTRRFRDPADKRAEHYYAKALDAFERLEDAWTAAWILFERADLALERSAPEAVAELAARSAELAREDALSAGEDWDHELLANLHRAAADAHRSLGRTHEAAVAAGRGVCHAYLFLGDPHAPDEYAQQFYAEVTTRVAEFVAALPDDAARRRFVETARGRLSADWVAGHPIRSSLRDDVPGLVEQIFPRGPVDDELRTKRSAFMSEWRLFHEDAPSPLAGLAELIEVSRD